MLESVKHNSLRHGRNDEQRVIQLQWVGHTTSDGAMGVIVETLGSEEVSEKINFSLSVIAVIPFDCRSGMLLSFLERCESCFTAASPFSTKSDYNFPGRNPHMPIYIPLNTLTYTRKVVQR